MVGVSTGYLIVSSTTLALCLTAAAVTAVASDRQDSKEGMTWVDAERMPLRPSNLYHQLGKESLDSSPLWHTDTGVELISSRDAKLNRENMSKMRDEESLPRTIRKDGTVVAQPRIVGGTAVINATAYPWYAHSLGRYLCGSSLVHVDILATAAHCQGVFLAGGVSLGGDVYGQGTLFGVEEEFPHPDYDAIYNRYDIMLVKLSSPAKGVPIVNWWPRNRLPDSVTVIGFGNLYEKGPISTNLMEVELPVQPDSVCQNVYPFYDSSLQMCAGGLPQGGKDSCQGDSGGPLFVGDTVYGLVSSGYGCARPGVPGINTRVRAFRAWMRRSICRLTSYPGTLCAPPTTTPPSLAPTPRATPPPISSVSAAPTTVHSYFPTYSPISWPSAVPSDVPSDAPSDYRSEVPSDLPSEVPSAVHARPTTGTIKTVERNQTIPNGRLDNTSGVLDSGDHASPDGGSTSTTVGDINAPSDPEDTGRSSSTMTSYGVPSCRWRPRFHGLLGLGWVLLAFI